MHVKFARTSSVKAFLAAYDRLEERGAREACWLALSGQPGLGKTKTVHWFAVQQEALYLRAKSNWTVKWMLTEMADQYGVDAAGPTRDLFTQVLGKMVASGRPMIMDEARNLLHDAKLLETLRDLTDVSENPMILSGEDSVLKRLTTRYPQIRSRISETVEFKTATLDDVTLICREVCEVSLSDQVVAEIYRQSSGFVREIKNAIGAIERIAKLQNTDTVDLSLISGRRLCQDRNEIRARPGV